MSKPKILIVGAGPVGLTLANLFSHYGIDFHIIDKKLGTSTLSKALAMHARSLELFEELNLSEEFIAAGKIVSEANIYADSEPLVRVDLSAIPSKYNYILSIEQSLTEQILERRLNKLGKQVLWNNELAEIRVAESKSKVKIINVNKKLEEMEFDYVCSCEGAHSLIRKQAKISFDGASYEQGFLLADARIESNLKPNSMHGFLSVNGVFALVPLKREGFWRIITTVSADEFLDSAKPTMRELLDITENLRPNNLKITEATWISYFHVHHRIVDRYRVANVFLLGDAAHIHSPLGGQGMNAGMHDAFNLASKFAEVLNNGADPKILDLYDLERRPAGRRVVKRTDAMTRILLARNYWSHQLQKLVLPLVFSIPVLRKWFLKGLAMIR